MFSFIRQVVITEVGVSLIYYLLIIHLKKHHLQNSDLLFQKNTNHLANDFTISKDYFLQESFVKNTIS